MNKILVLIQCPDQIGLVATISDILAVHGLNITAMKEFVDHDSLQFFTRVECAAPENLVIEGMIQQFELRLGKGAFIRVYPSSFNKKIAVLVTKEYHCLSDILTKQCFGQLGAEISCVIGNHNVLESFTQRFSIPFHHVSHSNKTPAQFEGELLDLLGGYSPDYIILAKFMRILSAKFIEQYANRIINIHHSFLPAFVGANPYRQAFQRGVKVIGATAHIVTEDLDNGPIIAQETIHINHNYGIKQLKIAGSEIERNVLSRALSLVLEDRVFITGNKTVIFE